MSDTEEINDSIMEHFEGMEEKKYFKEWVKNSKGTKTKAQTNPFKIEKVKEEKKTVGYVTKTDGEKYEEFEEALESALEMYEKFKFCAVTKLRKQKQDSKVKIANLEKKMGIIEETLALWDQEHFEDDDEDTFLSKVELVKKNF